jgi:CheY-like chemotaxis protein
MQPYRFLYSVGACLATTLVQFLEAASPQSGSIPMAEHQSSQSVDEGAAASRAAMQQPRLLVIDDDVSICTVIEKLGEKAGFAARRAVSRDEAAELLRAQRFDCITLDLSIGKDTGIELLNILHGMECTTPIIIISGSMRSMRDFAVSIGSKLNLAVQEPFSKPINFARLREALMDVRKKIDAPTLVPAA